ncbi:MAG: RNA methyltransferase [Sediminibacterium sp.]
MQLPVELLAALSHVKGFDRSAFETVHQSGEQVTSIRLNPFKPSESLKDLYESPLPWCSHAWYLKERPFFTFDPVFHGGAYYVQEASSMFLWYLLQQITGTATAGKNVLDLCAAPGGKSTLLSTYFADGLVVSNEVIKSRSAILVENLTKWGQPNVVVTNNDPDHFSKLEGFFDVIVVDAPCSGSGLFRKDPAAIEEWSEQNVQHCSQRQERILASILPALKEDGLLIYSTCSYSVEEDERIADWLVLEKDMESLPVTVPAEWNIVQTEAEQTGATGFRFYPNRVKGEGFFVAAFRKKTATTAPRYKELQLVSPTRSEAALLQAFYPIPEGYATFKQQEAIRLFPASYMNALRQLASALYIKKAGIEIGSIKGKDLIPSHELAVSILDKSGLRVVTVDKDQALQYLRRKELRLEAPVGWCLLQYGGVCLGWVKVLPNRINNYYPAEWRILKD